ncbi:hypothetical protein E8K88_16435 [Lampropedia aestuarii]|uniref:Uncharacterized protein n=1 Tax=Lampropedia aestuarii TaxID=2562762 RepID=A0A4S5BJ67_9BURK|nr:hypothetical protein [Lampropedia aestuarii]THJ30953.1 hypothetical protein E8K88_16435 [Lampropedia aestuarii]
MDTMGVIEKQWRQVRSGAQKVNQIQNSYDELLIGLSKAAQEMESELAVSVSGSRQAAALQSVFGEAEIKLAWAPGDDGIEGVILFLAKSNLNNDKLVIFEARIHPWDGHYFFLGNGVAKHNDWNSLPNYYYTILQNALFKQVEFSAK